MPEKISAEAGFQPEALDPVIAGAIDRLTKVVSDFERVRGALEPHLDEMRRRLVEQLTGGSVTDPQLLIVVEQLVGHLEKYARIALSLTKVTDEAARLRSFVAGGADQRPDLSSLSDAELSEVVLNAARGVPPKK
jgi:hypothetical protein